MATCDHRWSHGEVPGGWPPSREDLFTLRYTCWECGAVEDRNTEGDGPAVVTRCPPGTETDVTRAIAWAAASPENAREAQRLRTIGRLGPSCVGHTLEGVPL